MIVEAGEVHFQTLAQTRDAGVEPPKDWDCRCLCAVIFFLPSQNSAWTGPGLRLVETPPARALIILTRTDCGVLGPPPRPPSRGMGMGATGVLGGVMMGQGLRGTRSGLQVCGTCFVRGSRWWGAAAQHRTGSSEGPVQFASVPSHSEHARVRFRVRRSRWCGCSMFEFALKARTYLRRACIGQCLSMLVSDL